MKRLYFHPSVHWQLVFGIAWTNGKEFMLERGFVTIWFGPFACAIGLHDFKAPYWKL